MCTVVYKRRVVDGGWWMVEEEGEVWNWERLPLRRPLSASPMSSEHGMME